MSDTTDLRKEALGLALNLHHNTPEEAVRSATLFYGFITGGVDAPVEVVVAAAATPAAAAAKKGKPAKAAVTAVTENAAAANPTTAAQPASGGDVFGDEPAATTAAADPKPAAEAKPAADKKAPTEDDVRSKLTAVQSKFGNKEKALEAMRKYAATVGAVKESDRAALIADCDKLLAG